jgi:hypothetical protein
MLLLLRNSWSNKACIVGLFEGSSTRIEVIISFAAAEIGMLSGKE